MKQWGRRTSGLTMVASLALALGYCGGGSPAGPVTPTAPPVTTPTPTPAPTPDPPISASCAKLPVGTANAPCRAESPEYVDVVYNAIRTLQSEQSFIFDGDEVKSVGAYYVELIKVLDRQGLCAETDGEELGVTDSAGSNEQYDVLTANNRVRFGPPSYRVTCRPSAIPFAPRGLGPQIAGCPLAPSHEIACGREPSGQYYGDVEAAIDQLMKEKPEIFNFDDTAAGVDHQEEYECVYFPLEDPAKPEGARPVDYDDRDLQPAAPPGVVYAIPSAPIAQAAFFRTLERRLEEHLQRSRSVDVLVNRALGLFSRPGETRDAFAALG